MSVRTLAAKISQPWIPADRVDALVQLEPALILLGLALGSWVFYRLFLRGLNPDRHRRLRAQFKRVAIHGLIFYSLFGVYLLLSHPEETPDPGQRLLAYLGLLTVLSGAVVLIRTFRIILSEYLFLNSMQRGVPLLLINIFTLIFAIAVGGYLAREIFSVRLGAFMATSAALSLVLGLAAQDTLGNLFAGIALQFDKPYSIGDWIEVHAGPQKWTGQVKEISWRASLLVGLADEAVTIPNRILAQAQISNFSFFRQPIWRSQIFRLPHDTDPEKARTALLRAASSVSEILKYPEPVVLVVETHDSWTPYKLAYAITDFGEQFRIADRVIGACQTELQAQGLEIASQRMRIVRES